MSPRPLLLAIVGGAAIASFALLRHRGAGLARSAPGGLLIGNVAAYDALTRILLGPFFDRIAADVAAVAPLRARVLEVGCGPGHLSTRLARRHSLEVTGLDLDPAMIERAQANANRALGPADPSPSFLVGDAASLPFPDRSFDLVVSTLSMHHWADVPRGLEEIARVLEPGGRALIWDFPAGARPHPLARTHRHGADPMAQIASAPLRVVSVAPWRWPLRFRLTQRIELVPEVSSGAETESATDDGANLAGDWDQRDRLLERLDQMVASGRMREDEARRIRTASDPDAFNEAIRAVRVRHAKGTLDAAVADGRLAPDESAQVLDRLRKGEHGASVGRDLRARRTH
jgi:SAM-dependent methyltransferase